MATAVATKPSAPHHKMKRPPLPAVQTNGVHSHQSSPSPSMSTKKPPSGSGFKQPPPAAMANGVSGNVNGLASRLGNRRRDPQKPGDVRLNRSGKGIDGQRVPKTISAPYVKTQSYILKKYRSKSPSLIIHLHPTHFRFDQQDGSFSYNSPMKFILEHLKSQTVPHDMIEELQSAGVRFYEGCLIVQVQDHRSNSASSNSSTSASATKTDTNVPFSIHNYNQHLTPSPYVPYPQIEEEPKVNGNAPAAPTAEASVSKDKQASKGPNAFTVVLFPTPLSLQEEVFIQANTPDLRNNRKQSVQVPRTPASATIPPTPMSAVPPTPSTNGPPNKKQKMMISGQEIHEFESRAITTTAPPLFLDLVDNIEDAYTVLNCLTDPRHQQCHPAPKTRKRTVAELAADEAIAAQEQAYMLIMDERHNVSGPAAKAGTTDGEAGTATFEPRFETWQAIKNIKAEHKERAEREAEAKAHRDAQAALQKARLEQQAREHREDAIRRGREAEQQQAVEIQRQNHLKEKQLRDAATAHRLQENQQRQALANNQNQINHGHPVTLGNSQAQHSSPVVRNMTPNVNSSPLVGNVPVNLNSSAQGNASSPARPPSAMQHGHPGPGGVAMGHSRSRQPPSRTTTPLMNGTPAMPHATPVVGHATPRLTQGSPPMAGIPVTTSMPNQGMNGHQQYELMIRHQQQQQQQQQRRQADVNAQYQQRMQNGSPNPQMSPDGRPPPQTLHQLAQQNQHQFRNEYVASLQRQQAAQMQNGNLGHGMPNGSSPAQHLQQPRSLQQNPNQQPQPQPRLGLNAQAQAQLQACISSFYHKTLQGLAARHNNNPAAITEQEMQNAKQAAVDKGTAHFKTQQAMMRQRQQQIAHMQAMGQMPPVMNGQMNGMGAQLGGQQMSEQQRQAMMQMSQLQHMGGPGVHNVNGGMHAHMNGGGMNGMQ